MATEWDGAELIELCKQKRSCDITPYWDSLNWHDLLASYFADRSKKAWEDYESNASQEGAFQEALLSCEACTIACIHSLNPMADMLSQIINAAVLKNSREEHNVSPRYISKDLEDAEANRVKESWDKFYDSVEFEHLNAFCNKIKHRGSIRTKSMRFDFVPSPEGGGNVFGPFEYRGKLYPEMTVTTIVYQYRQNVRELIINTGVSINDHLKSL
jgi:hypothetical protein